MPVQAPVRRHRPSISQDPVWKIVARSYDMKI